MGKACQSMMLLGSNQTSMLKITAKTWQSLQPIFKMQSPIPLQQIIQNVVGLMLIITTKRIFDYLLKWALKFFAFPLPGQGFIRLVKKNSPIKLVSSTIKT